MNEKYMEMQVMQQQIGQIQQQLQLVQQQQDELLQTLLGLEGLKKVKNKEMLASIAPGIFVTAHIKDVKDCVVGVGAGIAVKKSVNDTVKMIEEQLGEIEIARNELNLQLQRLQERGLKLQKEASNV